MIERATYDVLRVALRFAIQLWPLWLFWFVWSFFDDRWRDFLLTFPDRSTQGFAFAWHVWPAVALFGPILLMAVAIVAYRLGLATRFMPLAGIAGVVIATVADRLAGVSAPRTLSRQRAAAGSSARPRSQRSAGARGRLGRCCHGHPPDVPADHARQIGPAPGARPLRQFRPCRLARHQRRTPTVPRPGRDPRRHRRRRGLSGRSGSRRAPAPSIRRTKAPGARAAPRRC